MKKEIFDNIIESLSEYKYTSMLYTDYEDIKDYEILKNSKDIILIYGYDTEAKKNKYYFAANNVLDLLNHMSIKENILVTFVPEQWVESFKVAGLNIFAIWNDYFKNNLDDIEMNINYEIATIKDSEAISQVTISCRGQSRGFTGQTKQWIEDWISGQDSQDTSDNAVIIYRNSEGEIVGVLCTCIYGHDLEKGPIVWIREVAVNPQYQRQGIARKLILSALSYGKSKGATRSFLAADECNEHAIHLYESIGFNGDKKNREINMYAGDL